MSVQDGTSPLVFLRVVGAARFFDEGLGTGYYSQKLCLTFAISKDGPWRQMWLSSNSRLNTEWFSVMSKPSRSNNLTRWFLLWILNIVKIFFWSLLWIPSKQKESKLKRDVSIVSSLYISSSRSNWPPDLRNHLYYGLLIYRLACIWSARFQIWNRAFR